MQISLVKQVVSRLLVDHMTVSYSVINVPCFDVSFSTGACIYAKTGDVCNTNRCVDPNASTCVGSRSTLCTLPTFTVSAAGVCIPINFARFSGKSGAYPVRPFFDIISKRPNFQFFSGKHGLSLQL